MYLSVLEGCGYPSKGQLISFIGKLNGRCFSIQLELIDGKSQSIP